MTSVCLTRAVHSVRCRTYCRLRAVYPITESLGDVTIDSPVAVAIVSILLLPIQLRVAGVFMYSLQDSSVIVVLLQPRSRTRILFVMGTNTSCFFRLPLLSVIGVALVLPPHMPAGAVVVDDGAAVQSVSAGPV